MVGGSLADTPSPREKTEDRALAPVGPKEAAAGQPGVTPEIVAVMEAAAAAFVGKKVRIVSIRPLSDAAGDSNAWASQGRDIIQTSHNLVQRGH